MVVNLVLMIKIITIKTIITINHHHSNMVNNDKIIVIQIHINIERIIGEDLINISSYISF